MRAVFALALKDLRIFTRTRSALFFTFVWPLMVAVLFGMLFGGSRPSTPRMGVAVADLDDTAGSRAFVDALAAREAFDVLRLGRDEALDAVRRGRRAAAIVLAPGFGTARDRIFRETPTVDVYLDPSRAAESAMIEGLLMQQGAETLQQLFANPMDARQQVRQSLDELTRAEGVDNREELAQFLGQLETFLGSDAANPPQQAGADGAAGWQPLAVTTHELTIVRSGPRNGYDITFPQAMLWGIFGCVMTFGGTFAHERVRGTLLRLQASPLSRAGVLGGKALAAFLAILIVLAFVLAVGVVFFGVRPASWAGLLAAMVASAVAFVGLVVTLASFARTEQAVGGIGPAVMMPLFLIGGAMIPLAIMPTWMVTVSHASPVKWAILAFEGAIWRGFTPMEMLLPCGILVAVGLVAFAFGSRAAGGANA